MADNPIAFWDSSAIVPLCAKQKQTRWSVKYSHQFPRAIVWWGTSVEIQSALARLVREKRLRSQDKAVALQRLSQIRTSWSEILPLDVIKDRASDLLWRYSLRAADSLQLAAALQWCDEKPQDQPFVCFDERLMESASEIGFRVFSRPGY
jgi:uncharacterized protein